MSKQHLATPAKFTPTQPILFLDIDGVLNSSDWYWRREVDRSERGKNARGHREIDPAAVTRLNLILDQNAECRIVVSSTWRLLSTLAQIRGVLVGRGFRHPWSLIDVTPDGSEKEHGPLWHPCPRGAEIQMWRAANGHTGPFAVLDDSTDMDDVIDHFVQTMWSTGLLDEHVIEVLALLEAT